MTASSIVGTAEHYAQFVKLARDRIRQLGITYATVDEICGFPDRYTNILLSGGKAMSVYSFFTLAAALALDVCFLHDGDDLAILEARSDWIKRPATRARYRSAHPRSAHMLCPDFLKLRAIKGAMALNRKLSKHKRRKSAQRAALARWKKPQQEATHDH